VSIDGVAERCRRREKREIVDEMEDGLEATTSIVFRKTFKMLSSKKNKTQA